MACSSASVRAGPLPGGMGLATPLAAAAPSHGLAVFRPKRCQTSGLVRARPGWTYFPNSVDELAAPPPRRQQRLVSRRCFASATSSAGLEASGSDRPAVGRPRTCAVRIGAISALKSTSIRRSTGPATFSAAGLERVGNPVGRRPLRVLVAADAALSLVVSRPDPAAAPQRNAPIVEDLKLDGRAGRNRQVKRSIGLDGNLGEDPPGGEFGGPGSSEAWPPRCRPGRNSLDHAEGLHRTRGKPRAVLELGL